MMYLMMMMMKVFELLEGKELMLRIIESSQEFTEATIAGFIRQVLAGKKGKALVITNKIYWNKFYFKTQLATGCSLNISKRSKKFLKDH